MYWSGICFLTRSTVFISSIDLKNLDGGETPVKKIKNMKKLNSSFVMS